MIISRTPMRVSFMGGGSDLAVFYKNGHGLVLSTAIDRYIYITVNKKFDDLIRISYSKTEMVESVDQIEHNIIREALKMVGIERGVDIVYMGDIPLGSAGIGLGSSSSLAVGVLNALYAYQGRHVSAEYLARQACEIEIDVLSNPIGKQDQYAAAYGGFNRIQFNSDDSVFVDPVICSRETKEKLTRRLMMFYTGIQRISSPILQEQKDNIDSNGRYISEMVAMVDAMQESVMRNDLTGFGELLHQGWVLKKQLASSISLPVIDECYEKAREAGAIGGKLLGAGGGGFLLLYCEEDKHDRVCQAMSGFKKCPLLFEPQGSKIIYVSN